MATVLGLDLGTNSIGWAIVDTSANKLIGCGVKIFPEALARQPHQRRRFLRGLRRRNYRFAYRFLFTVRQCFAPVFTLSIKKIFPAALHALLALMFATFLLLAAFNREDFQFWFNLAITTLLGWIAVKK